MIVTHTCVVIVAHCVFIRTHTLVYAVLYTPPVSSHASICAFHLSKESDDGSDVVDGATPEPKPTADSRGATPEPKPAARVLVPTAKRRPRPAIKRKREAVTWDPYC